MTIGTVRQTVAVTAVAERRGPASAAATMYAETPEPRAAREQHGLERRLARPLGADLGARPTKQAGVGSTPSAAHSGAGAELRRRPSKGKELVSTRCSTVAYVGDSATP